MIGALVAVGALAIAVATGYVVHWVRQAIDEAMRTIGR